MATPEQSKEARLKKINAVFAAYGLPNWEPKNLGDAAAGECEVLDLIDHAEIGPGRIEVSFRAVAPGVGETDINVRFGGRLVSVVPYLVMNRTDGQQTNGPLVGLCKRWRVETGDWSYELPKGIEFTEQANLVDPFDSPAHRVLSRIFGEICTDSLSAAKVVPIGGFDVKGESAQGLAFILAAEVRRPFPRRKGDGEIVLLRWPQILSLIDQGTAITDLATIGVLLRAARKFKFE